MQNIIVFEMCEIVEYSLEDITGDDSLVDNFCVEPDKESEYF